MAETTASGMEILMREQMRDVRALSLRYFFETTIREWRRLGLIVGYETRFSPDDETTEVSLQMHDSERLFVCRISQAEIDMGGLAALRFWLDTIERELLDRRDQWRPRCCGVAAPPPYWGYEARQMANMSPMAEEADAKARALFVAAAGDAAYQILESGQPIRIKGSAGTDYLLFKRASFCVERPSDGARLCAVVPDVPLYDHLLGIKLMVEHDEPAFLATANVSGGGVRSAREYRSGVSVQYDGQTGAFVCSNIENPTRW